MNISAVIITKNEEKNIKACLESISWLKEIIVVDALSEDKTVSICKNFTDNIFQVPWKGYTKNRNFGIEKATKEWILVIDADERVSPKLKEEIERVSTQSTNIKGYYIPRKSYFLGKWIRYGGWYPDHVLRLFKKKAGAYIEREVHETLKVEGATSFLCCPLVHYTYNSAVDFLSRLDRYSSLVAIELKKEEEKYWLFKMIFNPGYTFFQMYLIKRGFLDGLRGLVLAIGYSFYTFLKYAKLWEILRRGAPGACPADGNRLKTEHYSIKNIGWFCDKINIYSSLAARDRKDNKKVTALDLIFRPLAGFLKAYIIKQGFRDKMSGIIWAVISGMYTFFKYVKIWERTKK
jgi:glycosyltransferase involved in cell wall biosynthesis